MMDNVIAFHGPDHKSGVTMLAQSVAEHITEYCSDIKLIMLCMNANRSTEYVRDVTQTVEKIKLHLDHETLKAEDVEKQCRLKDNFYMLGGIENKRKSRFFYPETAGYLLNTIKDEFDVIICDTGNDLDNGLAIGALENAFLRVAVLTQQESMLKSFEDMKPLYSTMGLDFNLHVINKFNRRDPYDLAYINMRLKLEQNKTVKVAFGGYSRQAEMEYKTMMAYKDESYADDINAIANHLLAGLGFPEIIKRRRSKWKSSI